MNQYLLSVYSVEGSPTPTTEEMEKIYRAVDVVNEEIKAAGAWVFGGGLHEPSTTTVLRVENGEVLTTDGPFAEAKEQLGGFWVIAASDLDQALAWGKKATVACAAPIEVRPFQEEPAS